MTARAIGIGLLSVALTVISVATLGPSARAQGVSSAAIVLPPLPDAGVNLDKPPAAKPAPAPLSPDVAPPHDVAPQPRVEAPTATPPDPPKPAAAQTATSDEAIQTALAPLIDAWAKEPPPRGAAATWKKQRDGIAALYVQRSFAPLWLDKGAWTSAARAALVRLGLADEDALDLKTTPLPILANGDAAAMATAELALSAAVVSYAQEASAGRVDPRSVSQYITEKPEAPEPEAVLASVSGAADADATLRDFNPPQEGYHALREKLAELRRDEPAKLVAIATGPVLKVGMKDARAPLIRARFGIGPTQDATDDLTYDVRSATAIAEFQRANGLPASGQLTPRTVAALAGHDPSKVEDEIIANMERWRWEPRQDSPDKIQVNIPDYTVSVMLDGKLVHSARVIVGKPDTPTPIFSNSMKFIEVNPYWNVPQSIIKKEMLPKLAADPNYLHRLGYEAKMVHGQLTVRQPPGERNALGRIKFMFPNEHAVYLHDTPTRGLFNTDRRAYSHGCVRVDQPFKFAEIVLGKDSGWTEDKVKKLIGGANRAIQLPKHIDIHIEYFTAFVDPDGKLQLRDDIYGFSRKLRLAMGLTA